jgi:hypothetical protein
MFLIMLAFSAYNWGLLANAVVYGATRLILGLGILYIAIKDDNFLFPNKA